MSDPRFAVGIDLGTSTSEVCIYRNGETTIVRDHAVHPASPIIPSLIATDNHGRMLVGGRASNVVDLPGRGVREIKRQMGCGQTVTLGSESYRPEELSAFLLRYLKEVGESAAGAPIRDVVLSVPATFPDAARTATLAAAEIAGLNVLRLINEPTAAALAYGVNHLNAEQQILVFDFGGGTLDLSVLEMFDGVFEVVCGYGNEKLGGKDFDEVLIEVLEEKLRVKFPSLSLSDRQRAQLKPIAEGAKKALTSATEHDIWVANFAQYNGTIVDLELTVTRSEFEKRCKPLLDKARDCVQTLLSRGGVRAQDITRVLLVGGTTYMPCVRAIIKELTGRDPEVGVDPDLAVATGAALRAAELTEILPASQTMILTDVANFGLGLAVLEEVGVQRMLCYGELMPPNTTIPYEVEQEYSLTHEEQQVARIKIYQDRNGSAHRIDDAEFTGIEGLITDIPPSYVGKAHDIVVHFSYDVNGLATIRAEIPATRQRLTLEYRAADERMSDADKSAAQARVANQWKTTTHGKESAKLIKRAQDMSTALPPAERSLLNKAIERLTQAAEADDGSRVERCRDKLIDLMFDLEEVLGEH